MKNILNILGHDIKSGLRDFMIIFVLIMPLIIAVILNMLTSSISQSTLNVGVDPSIGTEASTYLEKYAKVEHFDNENELRERVSAMDDIYGVIGTEGGYTVIRQGNEKAEMHELLELLLDSMVNEDIEVPLKLTISDIGWKLSPVKQYGGSLLAVFATVMGGMVIMMGLVEEKQENTLSAMNVTPMERWEYVAGKSLLGFILPILHCIGILYILDYGKIDYLQASVIILCIALTSVIIGFVIGVNNDNVIGAISSMKVTFIPLLASVFGAIYLSDKLQFLLYWSPFYWAFIALDAIILQQATWAGIALSSAMILIISLVVFLLLSKKIRRGLN